MTHTEAFQESLREFNRQSITMDKEGWWFWKTMVRKYAALVIAETL
ncbi:hypothetical protein [Pseudoduganella lutea]|nr:hypothetical protein [Pseudoduganella lutea]